MKLTHFIVLIIFNIILTKEISEENKDKKNKIVDKINEILNVDEEVNKLIIEANNTLNKIKEKSENLDKALNNIKSLENNEKNYLRNFVCFLCFVVILVIIIYTLELKYEKHNRKTDKNIELNNNSNIISNKGEDTKLYFSL